MLGFRLDGWDYATFAALFVVDAAFIVLLYLILGLPGRLAIARNHPEAEAGQLDGLARLPRRRPLGAGVDLGPEADLRGRHSGSSAGTTTRNRSGDRPSHRKAGPLGGSAASAATCATGRKPRNRRRNRTAPAGPGPNIAGQPGNGRSAQTPAARDSLISGCRTEFWPDMSRLRKRTPITLPRTGGVRQLPAVVRQ